MTSSTWERGVVRNFPNRDWQRISWVIFTLGHRSHRNEMQFYAPEYQYWHFKIFIYTLIWLACRGLQVKESKIIYYVCLKTIYTHLKTSHYSETLQKHNIANIKAQHWALSSGSLFYKVQRLLKNVQLHLSSHNYCGVLWRWFWQCSGLCPHACPVPFERK